MYKAFFNLTKKPFDLLPDPDFLFMSSSHKKALSYLDYGIKERVGFILLTGEVGSGKTTIIRESNQEKSHQCHPLQNFQHAGRFGTADCHDK